MEFKAVFENKANIDDEGEHKFYKLQIHNNTEVQSGMFFSSRQKCVFCEREHKENCDFVFPKGCATF